VLVLLAFAVVILARRSALLEPDDFAYRASIAALAQGHLFLTTAQYHALSNQLGGIEQWHHLAAGWISEKNPGYPFLAVPFYAIGALWLTPLFFGALGALGLYVGGRRWLGPRGGLATVVAFCSSGAALVFGWRATMPSFTDASLIAAGVGGLLWVMLADEQPLRRRRNVGIACWVALDLAVFVRYTNVAVLFVIAVVIAFALWRRRATRRLWLPWVLVEMLAGLLVGTFNQLVYGGVTSTGYSAGEITFSLSSFLPNLRHMPWALTQAMPLWILATIALVGVLMRTLHGGRESRRDTVVALSLTALWLSVWLLYFCYTWTVHMGSGGPGGGGGIVHTVRFYLPSLGPLSLLAAWLLVRMQPRTRRLTVLALALLGALGFVVMSTGGSLGGGPGGAGEHQPPSSGGRYVPGGSTYGGGDPNGYGPQGSSGTHSFPGAPPYGAGPHGGDGYGPPSGPPPGQGGKPPIFH
jgi:hypothetical protein